MSGGPWTKRSIAGGAGGAREGGKRGAREHNQLSVAGCPELVLNPGTDTQRQWTCVNVYKTDWLACLPTIGRTAMNRERMWEIQRCRRESCCGPSGVVAATVVGKACE